MLAAVEFGHRYGIHVRLAGPGQAWIVNAEHGLLIEAIRNRDTIEAERILTGHIRRTRVQLAQHPELFQDHAAKRTRSRR